MIVPSRLSRCLPPAGPSAPPSQEPGQARASACSRNANRNAHPRPTAHTRSRRHANTQLQPQRYHYHRIPSPLARFPLCPSHHPPSFYPQNNPESWAPKHLYNTPTPQTTPTTDGAASTLGEAELKKAVVSVISAPCSMIAPVTVTRRCSQLRIPVCG